jgi:phosphoribosylanthranilate isomerase
MPRPRSGSLARRTWIKICGITRVEDACTAVDAGADALGFILTPSPRRVTPDVAQRIVRDLPPHVLRFGVFVDEPAAEVTRVAGAADLDRIQVHGPVDPILRDVFGSRVLRAFRVRDEEVLEAIQDAGEAAFLLDAYSPDAPGGTGRTFDWSVARRATELGRLILAGGLDPRNVGAAIREVRPFGVDVSTGVEDSPGRKNADAIRAFVSTVREADRNLGDGDG